MQSDNPSDRFGVECNKGRVEVIKLYENGLEGTLPDLSALTHLRRLSLQRNRLSGSIPDLSALVQLRELNLNNNRFSGTVPELHDQRLIFSRTKSFKK